MPKPLVLTLCTLLAVIGCSAAYCFGYFYGFADGTANAGDASATIAVIKGLREGKNAQAIDLLESQVDSFIVTYAVTPQHLNPMAWLSGGTNQALLRRVANYRASVPSQAADPKVRALIEKTVSRLNNGG
jgi:hypothetical protein